MKSETLPEVIGVYRLNYSLKPLNWFKVGGACDVFFRPHDLEDLQQFLASITPGTPIFTLGAGSNVLISDQGIPGVAIKLGQYFTQLRVNESGKIVAGAGALNNDLLKFCCLHGLQGLEFLAGIPGTIGGGAVMNAGVGYKEFKDVIDSVTTIDYSGNIHHLSRHEIDFSYRRSSLKDLIVVEVVLNCTPGDTEEIQQNIARLKHERHCTQPTKEKTCGSVFMNPPHHKAWQLIEQAGLRGYIIGGAQISTLHTNFIINLGDATAQDIRELAEYARAKVLETSGISLEWEIKRIGKE